MAFIPLNICHAACVSDLAPDGIDTGAINACMYEDWNTYENVTVHFLGSISGSTAYNDAYSQIWAYMAPFPGSPSSYSTSCAIGQNDSNGVNWSVMKVKSYDSGSSTAHLGYIFYTAVSSPCPLPPDSDGDGRPDETDLYPDDDTIYKSAITSVLYDTSTGEVVAGIISVDNGDQFTFGEVPANLDGYTSETMDSVNFDNMIADQSTFESAFENMNIDPADYNFQQVGTDGISIDANGFYDDSSTNYIPIHDIKKAVDAPVSSATGITTGTASTGTESDNEALIKIVDNTNNSNTNQQRIADYLKTNNDILAQISSKVGGLGLVSAPSSSGATAEDIGTEIKDNLEDPANNYDDTSTDNISDFASDQSTLDGIGTKYSDRFTSFKNTITGSDLFTLSDDLFTPPTSTVSSKTISIGNWGGSTSNDITIDMSDYDSIWLILRSIIMIMVSYAAFKIVVVKRA